jgi:hypothetical protein
MTRRQRNKKLRYLRRSFIKVLLSSRVKRCGFERQSVLVLKSLFKYNHRSKLKFVKKRKVRRLKSFKVLFFKKILSREVKPVINNIFKENPSNPYRLISNIKSLALTTLFKLKPLKRFQNRIMWLKRQIPYKKRAYVRKIIRRKAKNNIKLSALKRAKYRYST